MDEGMRAMDKVATGGLVHRWVAGVDGVVCERCGLSEGGDTLTWCPGVPAIPPGRPWPTMDEDLKKIGEIGKGAPPEKAVPFQASKTAAFDLDRLACVTRFDLNPHVGEAGMEASPTGEWIRFADAMRATVPFQAEDAAKKEFKGYVGAALPNPSVDANISKYGIEDLRWSHASSAHRHNQEIVEAYEMGVAAGKYRPDPLGGGDAGVAGSIATTVVNDAVDSINARRVERASTMCKCGKVKVSIDSMKTWTHLDGTPGCYQLKPTDFKLVGFKETVPFRNLEDVKVELKNETDAPRFFGSKEKTPMTSEGIEIPLQFGEQPTVLLRCNLCNRGITVDTDGKMPFLVHAHSKARACRTEDIAEKKQNSEDFVRVMCEKRPLPPETPPCPDWWKEMRSQPPLFGEQGIGAANPDTGCVSNEEVRLREALSGLNWGEEKDGIWDINRLKDTHNRQIAEAFEMGKKVEGHNAALQLRDHFAMAALPEIFYISPKRAYATIAVLAYEMADAMLKEREK